MQPLTPFVVLQYSLLIAVLGVVYSVVLTEPNQLFKKWRDYLYRNLMTWSWFNEQNGFSKDYPHPDNKFKDHPMLWMPLIGCELCVSGQLAQWLFLILFFPTYKQAVVNIIFNCSIESVHALLVILIHHIFTIACSILWAAIIKKFYKWIKH